MEPVNDRSCKRKTLDLSTLALGQRVLTNIYDKHAILLVPAGATLTMADLATLRTHAPEGVFVDADPAAPPPDVPVVAPQILEEVRRLRQVAGDKRVRQRERHPWQAPVTLELKESSEAGVRRRTVQVTTCDLSTNGFGFVAPHFVHPGTHVRVYFDSLPAKPTMLGIVRHCVVVEGRLHRVGVEFLEATRHK